MKVALRDFARLARAKTVEYLLLVGLGLAAIKMALTFPMEQKHAAAQIPGGEKYGMLWFHAHQMYGREPAELSEWQLENVKRWCRCITLMNEYQSVGLESLCEDDCRFVADTLVDLCPDLTKHTGYLPIYEACRQRLDRKDTKLATHSRQHEGVESGEQLAK